MDNLSRNETLVTVKAESGIYGKTVAMILVISAAIFIVPALAIILIADAFAIGSGSQIAIYATIAAAVFSVIFPIVFSISRRIGGPPASVKLRLLEKQISVLQQEVIDLKHQQVILIETAEFSKQLAATESREKKSLEKNS